MNCEYNYNNRLTLRYINVMCLLPMSIERFIAIAFPFYHRTILTKRNSWLMCLAVWVPNVGITVWIICSYWTSKLGVSTTTNSHL